ncbi:TPA: DUF859 family phage minor structural protein [Streptococcus suis]
MAKFSNASGSLYLNVYIEPGTQNIANNTTVVNWRITVSRSGAYLTRNEDGDSTLSLDLNGGRVHTSNPRWRTSGEEFTMASGSTTVGHNADGSKSVPFSATFNPNNGVHGTITVSGNIALTTIPRSSSVSVGSGTIGSALTININRQSSSFTHTLRYAWAGKSGTIATGVGTSHTWTVPMDFANDIPNSTIGTGTIYVDTYNGSTKTGTQQVSFSASVPASIKPSFSSLTLTDTNTVAGSLLSGNNFLQVISNIKVTFNGQSGSYGSSITGYKAEIVNRGQATTSNNGMLGIMNFNGSATIRASVVDSRGRWSDTKDITINVIEYFAPILSFTALRTRENPNIVQIVRNARIAPITLSGSQKNIMTLSFKVAPLGSTSYTADNGSASGSWTSQNALTNSAANMAGNYPANKSFVIVGTLSDKFTSTEFSATIATESVVMSYDKNGRVGIGKVVELGKAGSLDVAGDIYAGGNLIQQHQLTSNAGRSPYNASGTVDLNTKTINSFFSCNEPSNGPRVNTGHNQFYVAVYSESDNYVTQHLTQKGTGRLFTRTRHGGVWSAWIELAMLDGVVKPNTVVELSRLSITDTATADFGIMWGITVSAMRKGNLVTLTVIRSIKDIQTAYEYALMQEKIPAGYRPIKETHFVMHANSGKTVSGTAIVHIANNGEIRLTTDVTGNKVWSGTITYLTNDPYP